MGDPTCQWPACTRAGTCARGLCGRCAVRARRAGRLHEFTAPPRSCVRCAAEFFTSSRGSNRYCTRPCRKQAIKEAAAASRLALVSGRLCRCLAPISLTARSDARFCSTACQQAAWYAENDARLRVKACAWKATNRELANEYEHRRRAVKQGAAAERIDLAVVWDRDEGICWICDVQIDPALIGPDPWSRSLDHVAPLSRGGSHTYSNVALAHLRCNISKRDKVLDYLPKALRQGVVIGA